MVTVKMGVAKCDDFFGPYNDFSYYNIHQKYLRLEHLFL